VIPGAGHMAPVTHPGAVAGEIRAFLGPAPEGDAPATG
jgi:pimeloyl-ACP methyl ester carboxylesterase